MSSELNVIDLFSGCGGLSYGFERAGFKVLLGIDNDATALATFKKNHVGALTICGDISKMNGLEIRNSINDEVVDVIVGGPPCQGMSLSGFRNFDDPRNSLYLSFIRLVGILQPKIIVVENVPGLISLFNGKIKNSILEKFDEIGYNMSYAVLNSADYGVPQFRRRVVFVGLLRAHFGDELKYVFPAPSHSCLSNSYVTSSEAISDLPEISEIVCGSDKIDYEGPAKNKYQAEMRKGSRHVFNHVATIHTSRTREIISMVSDGGNYKDLPIELHSTRKVNIAWTRMNSAKPCFTIDTGHNHHFHYSANRVPTVRESARIQSFPDKFIFYGTKTQQLRQVGNAVPPLLAEVIARSIRKLLKEKY